MFLIIVILLVSLVLVLVSLCELTKRHRDAFTETPMLVLRVDRSPLNIHVQNPMRIKVPPVDHVTFEKSSCNDCNARVTDAYDMMIHGDAKLLAVLPSEQTVVFVKQKNFVVNETLHDVFDAEKPIGYRVLAHKYIILAIAASMGHKNPKLTDKLADAYAMCYVQTIEEQPLKPDTANPDVMDLGAFSPDILRAILPFVLIRNKDFARYVTNTLPDRFSIKTCLAFHNVIIGNALFDEVKYAPTILAMRRNFGIGPDVLEFYNMLAHKSDQEMIEKFIDVYEAKSHVPGFYDSKQGAFYPDKNTIHGLPLDMISRVNLSQQERTEENGLYTSGRRLVRVNPAPAPAPIDNPAAYKCVGKPDMINREQCDRGGGIWDRPCVKNDECPFYQANTTYRNYRGGCIDGSCEMPLGVQRIAFRGHGAKDAAICHGCPIGNPLCCSEQVRPDYAFPLDYFERINKHPR